MPPTTGKLRQPGVREWGAGWQVRVRFPGYGRHEESGFPTLDAANDRAYALNRLKRAGLTPANEHADASTLQDATNALLTRKAASGLRARGLEYWQRSCAPWKDGPHAQTPLDLLRRAPLEQTYLERVLVAPTSARNELQALKAILRHAAHPALDQSILTIAPLPLDVRRRRALTVTELDLLAVCAPDYAWRLLAVAGTAGFRIGELFTLTDDRLDLHAGTVLVTAELAKERQPKQVALDAYEVTLLREQLLARAPGTPLVFPTRTGKQWRRSMFHRLVWKKATARAAALWQAEHGPGSTPYDGLTPHDLRSTAATLMREAGFTREEAADRLGHVDSGELLDRVYDQGDRGSRARRALAARAPRGIRVALAEQAATPAPTPAAAAVLDLRDTR